MKNGMNKWTSALIFAGCMTISFFASAQDPVDAPAAATSDKVHVIGGHLLLGGAGIAEDSDSMESRARFAGGLGFTYNFYLKSNLSLSAGLDFIGKGGRASDSIMGTDVTTKTYLRCMEFPLGVMFEPIPNLQVSAALVFAFALSGKYKTEADGDSVEVEFGNDEWDNIRRFNIAPRITAGYAIPVGPIAIVPGLMWEMDLINAFKGDGDGRFRAVNLMLVAGVQYSL